MMSDTLINPYPDEPLPNDQFLWKAWWISKFFKHDEPLYKEDLQWVHSCWLETKSRHPNFFLQNEKS